MAAKKRVFLLIGNELHFSLNRLQKKTFEFEIHLDPTIPQIYYFFYNFSAKIWKIRKTPRKGDMAPSSPNRSSIISSKCENYAPKICIVSCNVLKFLSKFENVHFHDFFSKCEKYAFVNFCILIYISGM